jgi:DNA polymerase III subunit beta
MIEVNREQFAKAIDFAAATVSRRSTIPVLSMLKAKANGSLALEGSDLDTFTRAEIPYQGGEVEFLLPEPRKVRTAVNTAGSAEVRITPDGNRVGVVAGQLDSSLCTLPADDHPGADAIAYEDFGVDLGAAELRQIARVVPAISTEETRYYLNGVAVFKVGDWLYRFVTTDGHRLMMVDVPLPNATGALPDGTIIPRRWINIALQHFIRAKDGARLTYGRTMVRNSGEGKTLPVETPGAPRITLSAKRDGATISLTGKLIDGTFPDYTRVVPSESAVVLRINRADLAHAINSLTPLSTGKTRAVKFDLSKPDKLTVSLHSPDIGESRFEVACEHNAPGAFTFGLNGQYALDMLGSFTGDEIVFGMMDAASPILINDPADTAFRGVQMPMRV